MKVLHVIYSLRGGGAEKQCQMLANGMLSHGVDVAVFCVNELGCILIEGVSIFRFERKSKFDLGVFKSFKNAVEKFQPDVVHVWLPEILTIPAMLISKFNSIPVIFSYRRSMSLNGSRSIVEYIVAIFCSSKVISNNIGYRSSILYKYLYSSKDGELIYNGVSCPEIVRNDVSLQGAHVAKFLFVGRLVPVKNILFMLNVLSKINDRSSWVLHIFGSGELEKEINIRISELQLANNVKLMGFVSNIQEQMHKYNALLVPSKREGMPNVVIEAFASGLPVIASDIDVIRNIVDGNDVVEWFDPNDEASFLSAINKFLSNGKINSDRANRAKILVDQYSFNVSVEKHISIYKQLSKKNTI